MKKAIFLFNILLVYTISFSQIPSGYYNGTDGQSGDVLRQTLHNIIDDHTVISYSGLWNAFDETDKRSDGKVWDIYSNCNFTFFTDQCGTYNNICDCYNREHTVPQSWFSEASPMVSDLFHVYPTDGKVNGYRSNYPFGECNGTVYGTGKLGACTYPGYSGTVFEPADEFKGDIARTYFYMATRYMDVISGWSGESFSGNTLISWTKNMMIQWHYADPVSQKEIDRNNAIYLKQHNRNPYIDHPEWVCEVFSSNCNTDISDNVSNISISPNPTNGIFTLNLSYYEKTIVSVINVNGQLLIKKELFNEQTEFDISDFTNGIYIIRIENPDFVYYSKILKN